MTFARRGLAGTGAVAAVLAIMLVLPDASGQTAKPLADPLDAAAGKALFDRQWVGAPASTDGADGLGPLFNARSCNACHGGGRAAQFVPKGDVIGARGLVLRLVAPDGSPHPELGTQLQDKALAGLIPEGRVTVLPGTADLQVRMELFHDTATPVRFERRAAPSLRGRGAIDTIDPAAILALADPGDLDGDGISGRPHWVTDVEGRRVPGRFGSKAQTATLAQQTADAAAMDIGLSSPLVSRPFGDCTASQTECLSRASGQSALMDGEEISSETLRLMTAYVTSLRAPAPDLSSAGYRLFAATGCSACHVPVLPDMNGQMVPVFSDLLLHDLGPDSASIIREGDAAPSEWRTAPLRDLDPRDGARRYLHDGRAATIADAIRHHGGEAAGARAAFDTRTGTEQQELLDFLSRL